MDMFILAWPPCRCDIQVLGQPHFAYWTSRAGILALVARHEQGCRPILFHAAAQPRGTRDTQSSGKSSAGAWQTDGGALQPAGAS